MSKPPDTLPILERKGVCQTLEVGLKSIKAELIKPENVSKEKQAVLFNLQAMYIVAIKLRDEYDVQKNRSRDRYFLSRLEANLEDLELQIKNLHLMFLIIQANEKSTPPTISLVSAIQFMMTIDFLTRWNDYLKEKCHEVFNSNAFKKRYWIHERFVKNFVKYYDWAETLINYWIVEDLNAGGISPETPHLEGSRKTIRDFRAAASKLEEFLSPTEILDMLHNYSERNRVKSTELEDLLRFGQLRDLAVIIKRDIRALQVMQMPLKGKLEMKGFLEDFLGRLFVNFEYFDEFGCNSLFLTKEGWTIYHASLEEKNKEADENDREGMKDEVDLGTASYKLED